MTHERKLPLRYGGGEVVVRWRDTGAGPMATLRFNDRPLTITWRRIMTRNGAPTTEQPPDDAPTVQEFPARGLVDDIDTLDVEPARQSKATGLAALGASLDPKTWQTHRFVVTGGHSVSGAVYNSSVTSKRAIRIEIDTEALTAAYTETSDFDDG